MAGAFILTCLAMFDGAMAVRLTSESLGPVCRYPCNSPVVELQGKSFTIGHGVEYTAADRQCMGECVIVMKGWQRTDGCEDRLPGSQKVSKTRKRKLCCQVLQCPTGSVVEDEPLITTTTTTRESPVCCTAMTADCLSCKAGKTKEEFCAEEGNADVDGCEELRVEEGDDARTDETSMTTSRIVDSTSATTATAEKFTTTATTAITTMTTTSLTTTKTTSLTTTKTTTLTTTKTTMTTSQAGDLGVETDAPEEMVKAFGVSLAERLYASFDNLDEMEGFSSAELEELLSTTFSDNDKARLAAQGIV